MASFTLYPIDLPTTSYASATPTAQKNKARFTPVRSSPLAIILSNTFSIRRGTAENTSGLTSRMLSPMVSIDSAK